MKHDKKAFNRKTLVACYWAGFLAADGSIRLKNSEKKLASRLCLQLKREDEEHLNKFCKFIKCLKIPRQIESNKFSATRLDLYETKYIIEKLNNDFGVSCNKIESKPWEHLNKNKALAFMAGYIDGDGSVIWTDNKVKAIQVFGDYEMLDWFKSIMTVNLHRKLTALKNGYIFAVTSHEAKLLREKILKLNLPLMERKWRLNV